MKTICTVFALFLRHSRPKMASLDGEWRAVPEKKRMAYGCWCSILVIHLGALLLYYIGGIYVSCILVRGTKQEATLSNKLRCIIIEHSTFNF